MPAASGPPATAFRLLRTSAVAPTVAPLDLLSATLQPRLLQEFNPFLAPAALARLQRGLLVWLQLCVLEDRLERLLALAQAAAKAASGEVLAQVAALIKVGSWPGAENEGYIYMPAVWCI